MSEGVDAVEVVVVAEDPTRVTQAPSDVIRLAVGLLALLVVVLVGCSSAAVKVFALRRGFTVSLVMIISCHAAGVCAFVAATPAVYRGIDVLCGRTGAATLVAYSFIILFCAHAHLLAVVWAAEVAGRTVPRRQVVVHLTSYLAFWLATFHLVTAGSDAGHPWSRAVATVVMTTVVILTVLRAVGGRGGSPRRQRAQSEAGARRPAAGAA